MECFFLKNSQNSLKVGWDHQAQHLTRMAFSTLPNHRERLTGTIGDEC